MPAKNQTDPNSRNSQVLQWYTEHPGFHRCVTVAQAMGLTTHDVAAASWVLNQRGVLDRHRLDVGTKRKTPVTHYGIAATVNRPTKTEEAVPA
jgi:hypothetical protein